MARDLILLLAVACAAIGSVSCQKTPAPDAKDAKIVCLSPGLSETVWALGAGEQLVGVTRYCTQPPALKQAVDNGKVRVVGDLHHPAIEEILHLKPTHIFAEKTSAVDKLDPLRKFPAELHVMQIESLADILTMIREVGRVLGARHKADELVKSIEAEFVPIPKPAPRVLLVYVSEDPAVVDAIGQSGYHSEILVRLGAVNAVDMQHSFVHMNAEQVLAADPDLVIEINGTPTPVPVAQRWAGLTHLRAVKTGNVRQVAHPSAWSEGPMVAQFTGLLRLELAEWQARQGK